MPESTMSDADLAAQPVAYWTGLAYDATIGYIRREQAARGFTQPQFWLLRHLSPHDISTTGEGMTVAELEEAMATYLRPEDDLEAEAGPLLEREWLVRDQTGRLWLTDAGEQARLLMKQAGPDIRAHLHEGIADADYVTTLKVLQQMVRNAEG